MSSRYPPATTAALTGTLLIALPSFGQCAGELAISDVDSGATVLLNPGGGPNDPTNETLVRFANLSEAALATIEVCEIAANPYPGAPGYTALSTSVRTDVTFDPQSGPGSETNAFIHRISIPFESADLPADTEWGPLQLELIRYDQSAGVWKLAALDNSGNSPGFAEPLGDSCTVTGGTPPTADSLSEDLGDYGIYYNAGTQRGFAWANVDAAGEFAVGLPPCVEGQPDAGRVNDVVINFGSSCPENDPIGCPGDENFDGVVNEADLTFVVATWDNQCTAPPDDAAIHHCVESADNSAGEAEWGPGTAGVSHHTFDLRVVMSPEGDSWTTTDADATLTDPALTFFQHAAQGGDAGPPSAPVLCTLFPALAYDSYFTSATLDDPCVTPGDVSLFGTSASPTELSGLWMNIGGPGDLSTDAYHLARYTLILDDPCPSCHIELAVVPMGAAYPNAVLGAITGAGMHKYGLLEEVPFGFEIIDNCSSDVNDDGQVDVDDLIEIIVNWGSGGIPADANRDGIVDVDDLVGVILTWGPCASPAAACSFPEACN